MGTIAKGVTSLFGGRARRREQKEAGVELEGAKAAYDNFQFGNAYEGLEAAQVGSQGYDAQTAQAGTLGPAAQAQAATLGDAQGYESQGYESQGYDAAQAQAAQAQKTNLGEGTGFQNHYQNLQVNTAAADRQSQEADQTLAASQDAATQAGTGGGGATALLQAALKSKQGVADSIGQQETQNAQLRAQGATQNQQAALQQRNTARQSNIQQDQFNTSNQQQVNLANQSATNSASQFGAQAANQCSSVWSECS